MADKSDKLETLNRIRSVQEWMMQGFSSSDIIRQCLAKWEVSERQANRYIEKAYDEFSELREKGSKRRLYYHVETRMKLYRELRDKNTPKGARAACHILDSVAKLEGVMIEKHELTGKDGGPIETTQTVVILPSNDHESEK